MGVFRIHIHLSLCEPPRHDLPNSGHRPNTNGISMRLAVISDIHGNMEALGQVFIDIDRSHVDAICCLGDIIGYGPEPNEAISSIRDRDIPTVIGNHELAAILPEALTGFTPMARKSLEKTIEMLEGKTFSYIQTLQPSLSVDNCRLVHGFPPDSPSTYVSRASEGELWHAFRNMAEKICFTGHTHELEIIDFDGRRIHRSPLFRGLTDLSGEAQYIVNVGSVGQPRDGNNNAKYAIWDAATCTIDIRYIPYDIKVVADKIIQLGLPAIHARRLW